MLEATFQPWTEERVIAENVRARLLGVSIVDFVTPDHQLIGWTLTSGGYFTAGVILGESPLSVESFLEAVNRFPTIVSLYA